MLEEERRVLGVELDLARLVVVEGDPALGEQRRELLELRGEVAVGVAVAHELEALAALPEERRGQAERRVVGGVQPQLECECVAAGALVEVEAEQPRRLLQLAEPAVDPAREAPLERGVARAVRQVGLVGGEADQERVHRRRAGRRREADAVEAIARDPVDQVRQQLVDRAARGGRGRGDRVELGLQRVVERHAPEREPAAAAAQELRVDEPLGDGALGEPDDREGRLGARARVGGRIGGELDQLADAQLALGGAEQAQFAVAPDDFERFTRELRCRHDPPE